MAKSATKKKSTRRRTAPAPAPAPAASNGVTAELGELRELVAQLTHQVVALRNENTATQAQMAMERAERDNEKRTATQAAAKQDAQLSRLAPFFEQAGIDLKGCASHAIVQRGCGECREEMLFKAMSQMKMGGTSGT